jgi:hypothetical protein
LKIITAVLLGVYLSTTFAQTVGFYEDTPSGEWLYNLIDTSGAVEVDCSEEQLAVIRKAGAEDFVCFVDLGYPERPFDQDFSVHTQLDLEAFPGVFDPEASPGTSASATPESTDLVNTVDGHKATLKFKDGYIATIAISPYGSVAIFGRFQK